MMPTGYTAAVVDGTVTEFRDFALRCARAFGALITMRDDPSDAPIPDVIQAYTHNAERGREAKERLAYLYSLTAERAEIDARKAYDKEVQYVAKRNAEIENENARIKAMANKVSAWTPPTTDHIEMKKFMVDQLRISETTYKCDEPERLSGPAWLAKEIASAERDLSYHEKAQREEDARAAQRTAWIKALKASV